MSNSGFDKEIVHTSTVDYKKKFIELDDEVKNDLSIMTEHYFKYLKSTGKWNLFTTIKNEDSIFTTEIYFNRVIDNVNILFKIDYCDNSLYVQNIVLNYGEYKKDKIFTDDIFKNCLYNILFYLKIFKDEFKYNSLCEHYQHKDEIKDLTEFYKSYNRVLIYNAPECCVCLEGVNEVYKTLCDHHICVTCSLKLKKKICPMCRNCFCCNSGQCDNEDDD
jgi:hypothetical protein